MRKMSRWPSLMLVVAVTTASTPAMGADPMGTLLGKIQRAQDAKQFVRAAELAAPASRRSDLNEADRFLLAGLASESFGDAFHHGGAPRQPRNDPRFLCKQRTVLHEAAALASDAGQRDNVRVTLEAVAAELAKVVASGRAVPCEVATVGREDSRPAPAEASTAEAPPTKSAEDGPLTGSPSTPTAGKDEAPVPAIGQAPGKVRVDQRQVRAGLGTLIPGLLLLAPMAAVLAYRGRGERELWVLQAETADRPATDAEASRATALEQRYRVTTASAAVLGATGAALAVTGIVLLATGKRRSLVAVAPWGARNSGGLVLERRF